MGQVGVHQKVWGKMEKGPILIVRLSPNILFFREKITSGIISVLNDDCENGLREKHLLFKSTELKEK